MLPKLPILPNVTFWQMLYCYVDNIDTPSTLYYVDIYIKCTLVHIIR